MWTQISCSYAGHTTAVHKHFISYRASKVDWKATFVNVLFSLSFWKHIFINFLVLSETGFAWANSMHSQALLENLVGDFDCMTTQIFLTLYIYTVWSVQTTTYHFVLRLITWIILWGFQDFIEYDDSNKKSFVLGMMSWCSSKAFFTSTWYF